MLTDDQRWRIMVITVILETGWTFDYVESLSVKQLGDFVSYLDGRRLVEKTM